VDRLGQITDRLQQDDRTVANVLTKDVVVDVHHTQVGSDPKHDRVTDADELVFQPVIREERNDVSLAHGRGLLTLLTTLPASLLQHLAMLLLAHLLAALLYE
jgi:hypothetical protein